MSNHIFEILTPWVTKENEEKEADEKKYFEVLGILDPKEVSPWCDDLRSASYRYAYIRRIDEYDAFTRMVHNRFFRKKLRKQFALLNEKWNNLNRFLQDHFFVNRVNSDFIQMYPELKYENPSLYAKRLEELRVLVNDFESQYNNFVLAGQEKHVGTLRTIISILLLTLLAIPYLRWAIESVYEKLVS